MDVRQKGKRKEREVAKFLNDTFGTNCRRTPCSGGLSIKGDIIDVNPDSILSNFHFEIKNQEKLNIWQALAQSKRDASANKAPIVIFSRNREENYVAMHINDFVNLLERIEEKNVVPGPGLS